MEIKYYGLRGTGEENRPYPSGMIRVTKGNNYMLLERVTLDGQWVADSSLYRYFSGDSDDALPITEQEAMGYMDYLTSGQAARNKQNRMK